MKAYRSLLLTVSILSFGLTLAQSGKVKRAKRVYNDYAYVKTIEILLEVAEKGHRSVELFEKLGNSYYFNNDFEDAVKWYEKLMAMDGPIDPEYYFRYAQSLKSVENYRESDRWMQKFHESVPEDFRGRAFKSEVDYLSKIGSSSKDIEVVNLDINTSLSDFGTAQYRDQLIFASNRGDGKELYLWNEQPFLDLYAATRQGQGVYVDPRALSDVINTKYHESTAAFTPDSINRFMFFTRNNYHRKVLKRDDRGVNRLQMFRSAKTGTGTWDKATPIHFNSDAYSVAHPSISADGKRLYFASDMPGSQGQSDIYVVGVNEDGTLGKPENLGTIINTEGQESFPFINEEGDLYFSSDGHPGLGGLDVYVIRGFESKSESDILMVENVSKPINSPKDDFGYYENLDAREGFFTSNRKGGKGNDDIYTFILPECKQLVAGIVKDKDTQELIAGAKVTLFDDKGKELETVEVGLDATYTFELSCETEYLIRGEKATYIGDEQRFTTPSLAQNLDTELLLDRDGQEVAVGDDLAEVLDIPIIYFDLDRSNIRPDAAVELQKVIAVMKRHPGMRIDVRSHTDSRASFAYNDALSERRSRSTIRYLVEEGGIEASRLTGRGYGERQLVNHCSDGVRCSEEEHQMNRRIEFIVLGTK